MATLIQNKQQLNRFFSLCSLSGLVTIYIVKVSYEKKVAFDRTKIPADVLSTSSDYFYGYLVACAAMEIFSHNTKNGITTVTSIDPLVSENIKETLSIRLKDFTSLKDQIEKVDKYFQ